MPKPIATLVLRKAATWLHRMLAAYWFVRRPKTFGAHAVAITPRSTIVLVKLRYAKGWRLPGGGMKKGEDPSEAALRELREEIGMTSHGTVQIAAELEENPDWKRDTASLVIVREVEYSPRWNWEVEDVREASLSNLPPDMSARTLGWLAAVKPLIGE